MAVATVNIAQPINLYRPVIVRDDTGGTTESYVLFGGDWATIKNVSAQKTANGLIIQAEQTKQFEIAYRPSLDIDEKWLIEFEGVRYAITGIQKENNRNFKYIIVAKAKT